MLWEWYGDVLPEMKPAKADSKKAQVKSDAAEADVPTIDNAQID